MKANFPCVCHGFVFKGERLAEWKWNHDIKNANITNFSAAITTTLITSANTIPDILLLPILLLITSTASSILI